MELERTVSEKGQMVIPKDVRKKLGFRAGTEVVVEIEGDKMIVKRKMSPKEIVEDFLNVVPRKKRIKKMSIKELERLIDEEYEVP